MRKKNIDITTKNSDVQWRRGCVERATWLWDAKFRRFKIELHRENPTGRSADIAENSASSVYLGLGFFTEELRNTDSIAVENESVPWP